MPRLPLANDILEQNCIEVMNFTAKAISEKSRIGALAWQNDTMAQAREPNWLFLLRQSSDIACCEVHDVFTEKVSKILFPACH